MPGTVRRTNEINNLSDTPTVFGYDLIINKTIYDLFVCRCVIIYKFVC